MIRCIAVDDEPMALDLLEDNISKVPFLKLEAKCKNPIEAIKILNEKEIDLVFLDIQMPGLTGIQFIKSLQKAPLVIFVTAYEKFALEGFELNVLDYLVKPVALERFIKAAQKAKELLDLKKNKNESTANDSYFFVNAEYSLVKIITDEILFIEGLKDYVKIFLSSQSKPILTRLNLKNMEDKLPADKFFRVHKSYIVSLNKITSVRKNRAFLGEHEIPVGDIYKEQFYKTIGVTKNE